VPVEPDRVAQARGEDAALLAVGETLSTVASSGLVSAQALQVLPTVT
jgi:hypothetical protein